MSTRAAVIAPHRSGLLVDPASLPRARLPINDLFRSGKLKDEARRGIERELVLREAHLINQQAEE